MDTRNVADAWKDWLDEHSRKLLLFARQRAASMQDAEDMLQELVIRLWHYQKERKHRAPDLPLAYSTLRLIMLDHGRKEGRRMKRESNVIMLRGGNDDVWNDPSLEESEDAVRLRQAVGQLSEKLREVLTLKIWGELTFAQIAEVLNISKNTAASRYRYALEGLQAELNELKEERYGTH